MQDENYDHQKTRRFYIKEQNIDILFLINENRVLTPLEFKNTLPLEDYQMYVKKYYQKKLLGLFNHHTNSNYNIFKTKYLTEDVKSDRHNLAAENFTKFSNFIALNGYKQCYDEVPITNIRKFVFVDYEKKDISNPHLEIDGLKFDCYYEINEYNINMKYYIPMETEFSQDKINEINEILFRRDDLVSEEKEISNIKINKTGLEFTTENDLQVLKNILYNFIQMYNSDLQIDMIDIKTLEEKISYILLYLRIVFNFCARCFTQYDNKCEMLIKCGDYHISSGVQNQTDEKIFMRCYRILMEWERYIDKKLISENITNNFTTADGDYMKCKLCHEFETDEADYMDEHLTNDHNEIYINAVMKNNDLQLFVTNIDIPLLCYISGIIERTIPDFASEEDLKGIKYHYPGVFSGKL